MFQICTEPSICMVRIWSWRQPRELVCASTHNQNPQELTEQLMSESPISVFFSVLGLFWFWGNAFKWFRSFVLCFRMFWGRGGRHRRNTNASTKMLLASYRRHCPTICQRSDKTSEKGRDDNCLSMFENVEHM
mgnify:CR=1 FL=1